MYKPLGDYLNHEGETEGQAAYCSDCGPNVSDRPARPPASGQSSDLKHGVAARICRPKRRGRGWVHTDRTMLKEPSNAAP